MRGVPDATRDLQVFWDDRFYQIVFGNCLIWVLDLMSETGRIGKSIVWLAVDYASAVQLIRWQDTATDESTECTSGAFVIAPSAVTTLFRTSISIYDHSIAIMSVRTVSNGE
jgi:hypothetical protein